MQEYWKQTSSNKDERKTKKEVLQKNKKISRNKTLTKEINTWKFPL